MYIQPTTFTYTRGANHVQSFTVGTGSTDITGWSISIFCVQRPGLAPIFGRSTAPGNGVVITNGPAGQFQLTLPYSITSSVSVPAGQYTYEVWRTDGGQETLIARVIVFAAESSFPVAGPPLPPPSGPPLAVSLGGTGRSSFLPPGYLYGDDQDITTRSISSAIMTGGGDAEGVEAVVFPSGGDDTVPIQAALTAVGAAGGGIVRLGAGTFTTSDVMTVAHDAVQIRGCGEATTINHTIPTGHIFRFAKPLPPSQGSAFARGWVVRDLRILRTVEATSGAAIRFEYATAPKVYDVTLGELTPYSIVPAGINHYDGVVMAVCDNGWIGGLRAKTRHWGVAVWGDGTANLGLNQYDGSHNFWIGGGSYLYGGRIAGSVGIYVGGQIGGVQVEATDIGRWDRGILCDGAQAAGIHNRELMVLGCFIDACKTYGIDIAPTGCAMVFVRGGWSASHGYDDAGAGFPEQCAINVQGNQPFGGRVVIEGVEILNCRGSAIQVTAERIQISNNWIWDIGKGSSGGHGIYAAGFSPGMGQIACNYLEAIGNASAGRPITVADNSNNYHIHGNTYKTVGQAINYGTGTGTQTNNVGF